MNLNDLNVVILNFSENKIQYNFRDYFFTCWQLFIISSVNILESHSQLCGFSMTVAVLVTSLCPRKK